MYALTPVICPYPPANSGGGGAPSITGQDYVGATLTANVGTWTPGVPNTPTYTYQWERCTSTGCSDIAGATGSTYTSPVGSPPSSSIDLGDTLEVVVTATNLDGSATATSAPTSPITLPPAPTNVRVPAITGILGEGNVLTSSTGTWDNGVASETYTWLSCVSGTCTPIPGQINNTTNTYTAQQSDEGNTVEVEATATNIGGSTSATSSPVAIPLPPENTAAPSINDGSASATGVQVLAGDRLTAQTGTWQNTTSFTYVWEDCSGGTCSPINGATNASYTLQNSDVNDTIELIVTGHNANVGADGMLSATSAATGSVLANDLQPLAQTDVPDGAVEATAPSTNGTAYVGGSFDTVGVPVGGAGAVAVGATTSSSGTPLATTSAVGNTLTDPAGFDAQATGGAVNAVISDGAGGYYLGGSFTAIQGTPCAALAHITSAGALDPAFCESGFASGAVVNALSTSPTSGLLAVGGSFSITTASNTGSNLVFIDDSGDGSNGTVLFPAAAASAPSGTSGSPNGTVYSIVNSYSATSATSSTTGFAFYVGGAFTSVGGTTDTGLVLETATGSGANATIGQTTAWPAALCSVSGTATGTGATQKEPCGSGAVAVHSLYYTTIAVLVGGDFTGAYTLGATAAPEASDAYVRGDAASFGPGTVATVEGWNPLANGEVDAIALPPAPSKTTANGTYGGPYTVYIGGQFTKLGTASYPYLAEFGISVFGANATTAASAANDASPSTSFTPAVTAPVYALASGVAQGSSTTIVSGGTATQLASEPTATLYVGGAFTSLFGSTVHRVGAINGQAAVLTTPATLDSSWEPNAGQTVTSLANDGTNIFVGGQFLVLGGVVRQNLAEISPTTGVTGWNPGANGTVDAITESNVSGTNEVYVGGSFTSAGGGSSPNLAAIDPVAGTATSWDPAPNGIVSALLSANNDIYIGGSFSTVDGTAEANVAAVSPSSGAPGTTPGTNGPVDALANGAGGLVYIGGSFSSAGGAAAGNLASINPNGSLGSFADMTNGPVQALIANSADVYVGGSFTTADGTGSPDLAAFSTGGGLDSSWEPTVNGTVNALTGVGNTVYVGGAFTTVDGNADSGLVGLTADTATPTSFTAGLDGPVTSIGLPSGGGLIVGGSFIHVSGAFSPNLESYGS